MISRRIKDEAPANYPAELYDDDEDPLLVSKVLCELKSEDEFIELRNNMYEESGASTSVGDEGCQWRNRSCSSVLKVENQPDLPAIGANSVNEHGISAYTKEEYVYRAQQNVFLTPDAHASYKLPQYVASNRGESDKDICKRKIRGRGVRRAGRVCKRGRRGRGRGAGRSCRDQGTQWAIGHSIEEVWMRDDDFPAELKQCAQDEKNERLTHKRGEKDTPDRYEEERGSEDEEMDECEDASVEKFDQILEGESHHFKWCPMGTFCGEEECFRQKDIGSVKSYSTSYDAFRSFWDDNFLQTIADDSNRHAAHISSAAFQSEWYPTNIDEILCLFAFWMMLGIIRMPTMKSCFSSNPLLKTDIFRRIFTQRRYNNLSRVISFAFDDASSTNNGTAECSDRLFRLRPIISHLNTKFQANYIPSKDICIGENLILWKGKLDIKQYDRVKASKFRIKTFELCESSTGYLWSFIVYRGNRSSIDMAHIPMVLQSSEIVKKLMEPLLNKGYRLFMDEWFNSPHLARFLKCKGTDCVGALRPHGRYVPALLSYAPLNRGQFIARHSGDVCVLSWQDKERVTMISTCHGSATGLPQVLSKIPRFPLPFKPQMVLDYNKAMGGVDFKDQMLEPYLMERRCCGGNFFKRLVNSSILNARTLLQSSTQCLQDDLNFRLQLVDTILTRHHSHCPQNRRPTTMSLIPQSSRMGHQTHWPVYLPQNASSLATNRKTRQRCIICLREGRKMQKTAFKCETCNVPLCIDYCFKTYHTS